MKKVDQTYLIALYALFVQVLMIILKLFNTIEASWVWVFWPLYVSLLPITIYIIIAFIRLIYNFFKALKELLNN